MEVFGDAEALKKVIESKYSLRIKEAEKEKDKKLEEIDKELKKKLEILNAHMKMTSEAEAKKAYSMVLSKEKLNAKKEFEELREKLIDSVFKEADKRAKKFAHSEEYIEFVRENMPKDSKAICVGDSDYYKKLMPNIKVDNNLVGVKFESDGVIYDFTLNNIIESKKDVLRQEISKVLFKQDGK